MKAAGANMKAAAARKPKIQIAVVETDPLRMIGLRALFDTESDFELSATTLAQLATEQCRHRAAGKPGRTEPLRHDGGIEAARPDLRIIVTGTGADDEMILKALAVGAKGYADEGASPEEFVQAIRIVQQGSVWAPRRVLSMFIERVTSSPGRIFPSAADG